MKIFNKSNNLIFENSLSSLRGADLHGAELRGAENIKQFGPMNTSGRFIYAVNGENIMVKAGCFWGTLDELKTAVVDSHNDKMYLSIIEVIKIIWL